MRITKSAVKTELDTLGKQLNLYASLTTLELTKVFMEVYPAWDGKLPTRELMIVKLMHSAIHYAALVLGTD
jgi:hypothetical protein